MSIFSVIVSKVFHQTHPPGQPVDVAAVLNRAAEERPVLEPLNWSKSIVDMLKLLELDSGLDARRALAEELRYGGDPNDTLHMNRWLHREVMNRLAERGARVPPELRH